MELVSALIPTTFLGDSLSKGFRQLRLGSPSREATDGTTSGFQGGFMGAVDWVCRLIPNASPLWRSIFEIVGAGVFTGP